VNRRTRSRIAATFMAGVLVLTVAGSLLSVGSRTSTGGEDATTGSTAAAVDAPPATQASDLPTVAYSELPPEGQETLQLIVAGGPFPYDRDGVVFQNREGLLPDQAEGYYREYTVPTPGEDDRGARRIIVGGRQAVAYYTDDHYESFREVVG